MRTKLVQQKKADCKAVTLGMVFGVVSVYMHVCVTVEPKAIGRAPQRTTARGVRSSQLANGGGRRGGSLLPRGACARPSSRMEGGEGQQTPACRERGERGGANKRE